MRSSGGVLRGKPLGGRLQTSHERKRSFPPDLALPSREGPALAAIDCAVAARHAGSVRTSLTTRLRAMTRTGTCFSERTLDPPAPQDTSEPSATPGARHRASVDNSGLRFFRSFGTLKGGTRNRSISSSLAEGVGMVPASST